MVMKQSIFKLVEAVRALRLSYTEAEGKRRIRLGIPAEIVQDRLLDIHDALEEADADGALLISSDETERLNDALNGVFKWIRIQGLALDEPLTIVADAIGLKRKKKPGTYTIMPSFAPAAVRKKAWNPKMSAIGDDIDVMRTLAQHRRNAENMHLTASRMGAAAPR